MKSFYLGSSGKSRSRFCSVLRSLRIGYALDGRYGITVFKPTYWDKSLSAKSTSFLHFIQQLRNTSEEVVRTFG